MRALMERWYFAVCLAGGWLLRSAKYATVRIVDENGARRVRKQRRYYAPLLIALSRPLERMLATGVHVLSRRAWAERERLVYAQVHGVAIGIEADGTLVLPCFTGRTLASVLEDRKVEEWQRERAIELAVSALAALHARGFTHGDAMAGNVVVDLEAGCAHWVDFETVHRASRPLVWRRADDVRALLATCLVRTAAGRRGETCRLILDVYGDAGVTRELACCFASVSYRALCFHLGQARFSVESFRETGMHVRGARQTRSSRAAAQSGSGSSDQP